MATEAQGQPDTAPDPEPKEDLQKKELEKLKRMYERRRSNRPRPLRDPQRLQPQSVQRDPEARERDEALRDPSRMTAVTHSPVTLRQAVQVASTASAIEHEAEKQETRDEKE